jgi:hypothetical protein
VASELPAVAAARRVEEAGERATAASSAAGGRRVGVQGEKGCDFDVRVAGLDHALAGGEDTPGGQIVAGASSPNLR